ncbi:MAG: 2Fe-2S iron-sulfur cluster-binding protein [Planctomycetes bacterium]|nr:2Fe-2S iron-sulfur cluster-binding protein [Planctomycetota bacterium]
MSQFKVTFLKEGVEPRTVEVDTDDLPYDRDGKPGSILDIALGHGIDLDHACGGVCACSTCHVILKEGNDSFNESSDAEEDQLDRAPGLTMTSRLGCQAVPDGSVNVVVEIPLWNRNNVLSDH